MPTAPNSPSPRPPRPRSASPAERSVEFAETQRKLKEEAAERRRQADASSRPGQRAPRT
jgi:hypothetical protein